MQVLIIWRCTQPQKITSILQAQVWIHNPLNTQALKTQSKFWQFTWSSLTRLLRQPVAGGMLAMNTTCMSPTSYFIKFYIHHWRKKLEGFFSSSSLERCCTLPQTCGEISRMAKSGSGYRLRVHTYSTIASFLDPLSHTRRHICGCGVGIVYNHVKKLTNAKGSDIPTQH